MSLTEREKEIALECWHESGGNPLALCNLFLSRIREEQKAIGWYFNDGINRCIAMSTNEKERSIPVFTTPPAAPYCPRQLTGGGMSSTAVVCGDESSRDVLIKQIQEASAPCDCSELVEALEVAQSIISDGVGVAGYHLNGDIAEWESFPEVGVIHEVLANHAKRVREEE